MAAKPLNPLDASWLLVESRHSPMHVAGLLEFTRPEGTPPDFLRRLLADFRTPRKPSPPWNQRLLVPMLKGVVPVWTEVDAIDLEHHVRLSALPKPGGERELGQHIARLHSQPLDFTRPPWEFELIEGLAGNRFAIYTKMHHSLIDGISGMRLLNQSMAPTAAASRKLPPFFAARRAKKVRARADQAEAESPGVADIASGLFRALRGQISSAGDVARAFGSMLGSIGKPDEELALPFDTPTSILNGRITGQRRFATQQFAVDRLRAVARAAGATLNDVVLALCGSALRRFLIELDALPDKPLTAGIPVSVRPRDDAGHGNAITFIIATLGTDIADARERIDAIRTSTRRAKEHVARLPRRAMTQYTIVLMAPYILSLLTGVGGRTRPMFNVTISNVPGPDETLYFRGARLDATYPVSLVSHGQALNITCHSYAGTLNFGFVACRDALPHMQRLAPYTADALTELEQAFADAPRRAPRRTGARHTTPATAPVTASRRRDRKP